MLKQPLAPATFFYTGIVGANAYARSKNGGISGIVANDQKHTIVFHLTAPDGTFLDYAAGPGQVPGVEVGQLAPGSIPLSAADVALTAKAAAAVRAQKGAPTPGRTPTPGQQSAGTPGSGSGTPIDG